MTREHRIINGVPLGTAERFAAREASSGGLPHALALGIAKDASNLPPTTLPRGFAPKPHQLTKGKRRKP